MACGVDGCLGGTVGCGGGDSLESGQNRASLLGKLLRVAVESGESPYGIPKTNPFVDKDGMRPEIWSATIFAAPSAMLQPLPP